MVKDAQFEKTPQYRSAQVQVFSYCYPREEHLDYQNSK